MSAQDVAGSVEGVDKVVKAVMVRILSCRILILALYVSEC